MGYPIDKQKIEKWIEQEKDLDCIALLRLECEEIIQTCKDKEDAALDNPR